MSSVAELKDAMHAAALALVARPHEGGAVEVEVECNGVRCVIRVGPAKVARKRDGDRTECKRDILAVMATATGPLIRKKIVAALKAADTPHPTGTVAKALADLTAAGELVNPRDRKGYRLAAAWQLSLTPDLFD